jgi:hypothetical protein
MTDSRPVDLGRFLHHGVVDRAALGSGAFTKAGWRRRPSTVLDLEATEFVDYAAAARLVSLVEGLVRSGVAVEVRLPNPARREGEDRFLDGELQRLPDAQRDRVRRGLEQRINARRGASSFLRHIGVVDALALGHLPEPERARITLTNVSGAESRIPEARAETNVVGGSGVRSFPAILPLRWISTRDQLFHDDWQQDAIDFLFDQGVMIAKSDAESLVTTVFRELIENVLDHGKDAHASPPGALFGAITLNRSGSRYNPNQRDSYLSYHDYLTWLATQDSPIVRVIVTDSGSGLVDTLQTVTPSDLGRLSPAVSDSVSRRNVRIVRHAFEPAVSSKNEGHRRGVGLTIVRRFVRSYRGLVSVRTANVAAGFECREAPPTDIADPDLHYVPGTAVELFFGLALRSRQRLRGETAEAVDLKDVLVLDAGNSEPASQLTERALALVEASEDARLPVVVLLIDGWPRDRDARATLAHSLCEVAAALEGHAAVCAVLDAASDVDCDTVFTTIDELHETPAAEGGEPEWRTPLLVLSTTGRPLWASGTHQLRGLLYRLLDGETIDIDGPSVLGLDERSISYLQVEQEWFSGTSRVVSLRVTPPDIDRAIAVALAAKLGLAVQEGH